jgi:hypothetical protein
MVLQTNARAIAAEFPFFEKTVSGTGRQSTFNFVDAIYPETSIPELRRPT